MKKRKVSRLVSMLLIFVLAAASLAGCGLFGGGKSATSLAQVDMETVYKKVPSPLDDILKSAEAAGAEEAAEEAADQEASDEGGDDEFLDDMGAERFNFISVQAAGGKYYVLYSDLEDAEYIYLCIFDAEGKNGMKIAIPSSEDGGVTHFCVAEDASLIMLDNFYDVDKEVFVHHMGRYTIEAGEKPALKEVWKVAVSEEDDFYPNGIVVSGEEIFLATETDMHIYNAADGKEKLKAAIPADFYGNICRTPSGAVLLAGSGKEGISAYTVDPATGKYAETKYETGTDFIGEAFASGFGDYDFYTANSDGVFGFRKDQPKPVKVFDYMASDMEIESIIGCAFLTADTAVLTYYNMDFGAEAALFKKAGDQQGGKVALSIACTYADANLSKAVVNFNKKNDKYRVVLRQYPYDDEGNNTLNMEIAAGNIPDMLCISEDMPVESYAAKGMFEDIEPMFQADEEIAANDYLDNVINASRIDGTMYFVAPSFNVIGLIGKKKEFGKTVGVTTAQMEKMIKDRGLSYDTAMGITSRDNMLSWVMFCAMDEYVDWDKGTCSFGSESFINLLKFCQKFPKKINYENTDWTKLEAAVREGRQLVRDGYIYNFDSYMRERYGYVGEEIAFMGYPGNGENGPVIQNELAVAITHNSDHPEGCWEFLREFYLEEYQHSIDSAFPVSLDALQIMADKAMNPKIHTYTDENGEEVSEPETGSVTINDKEIKLPVPSQEDIDTVMEFLASLKTKASVDSKITEIVNEESGAFFAGQKGAEETADIIQSRVRVYISETK